MKKKLLVVSFAIVLTMVFAVAVSTSALAVKPIHQASGGGNLLWESPSPEFTFEFAAHQIDQEGNAKGQFQVRLAIDGEVQDYMYIYMEVLHLAVNTSTGDAWIGVKVTDTDVYGITGWEFVWRVQDNGQGKKAAGPDMISGFNVRPAMDALSMPSDVLLEKEWNNGNVQVR